jgi:hypothetical protein
MKETTKLFMQARPTQAKGTNAQGIGKLAAIFLTIQMCHEPNLVNIIIFISFTEIHCM